MAGQIAIDDIEIDESLYPRTGGVEWRTIITYRQAMQAGSKFPPIVVAPVNGKTVLIDGRHRLEATKKLKKKTILAETLKRMTPEEAFVEALNRNITNGRPFSFYDKMEAYRILGQQGHTIQRISGILNIPQRELRRYKGSRFTISTTGEEVTLKSTLKHLADQKKKIMHIDDQATLQGAPQEHIINQLIIIIANGWLDKENETVTEGITKLKELLKVT